MDDGGMGSVRFIREDGRVRKLSNALVEAEFQDSDGVIVLVSLNLDDYGELFEFDFWKVNFSKLIKYPEPSEITIKRR